MASSSSAIDSCDNYDVFLSFRGDDTRNNFTSHLYEALCCKKINTFIDYNIKRGKEITQAIERVIEGAKISIIVFSPDYASSTFCLDELVKIMQCEESKQQIVLPIFYKVEPSEKTYQEAFERRIPNFSGRKRCRNETNKQEKVKEWKSAFSKALKLAGWPIDDKWEMTPLKWSLVNLPEITWNTLKSLLFLLKRLCKIYRIQWPNQEICKEETEKQYRGTHHRLMGLSVLNLEC